MSMMPMSQLVISLFSEPVHGAVAVRARQVETVDGDATLVGVDQAAAARGVRHDELGQGRAPVAVVGVGLHFGGDLERLAKHAAALEADDGAGLANLGLGSHGLGLGQARIAIVAARAVDVTGHLLRLHAPGRNGRQQQCGSAQ
jgi:hypothetical protein